MGAHSEFEVARLPLIGAAGLILMVLATAATVRLTGIGASLTPESPSVAQRALRFEDRPDGSIAVLDAAGGGVVHAIAPATNGFLRGTLRGLARERKRRGFGPDEPFVLSVKADGRFELEDPDTGRHIDLGAFGASNAAAFAQLLPLPQSAQHTAGVNP